MHSIIENIGLQFGPGAAWLLTSTMIFLRFAIPTSLAFLLVYKWKRKEWFAWKIQQRFPKSAQIRQEISYSLLTSLLFGGMALGVFFLRKMGYGQLYFEVAEYGWVYWVFSLAFLIVAHDTYFYWMHRLMHHPKLYRRFHLVHHKSTNPTPYTSFSFHPLESVLEFAIIPVLTLVLPVHAAAFFLFTLWSILFNVLGHTGYEISPSGFTRHRLFKWLNTPTHHNMHHHQARFNYGLYFNFWDRVMGTNHPEYDQYFEEVVERTGKTPQSKSPVPLRQQITKAAAMVAFLLCSSVASGQMSLDDIKEGNYGTPEYRTQQVDSLMRLGLALRQDQLPKVHDINLRSAKRVEEEVITPKLSDWSKYRRLSKIQNDKDKEMKAVLNATQFEKYAVKRDELFWKGIQDFFF
ncbi:MAG: sterol desaturase family protein [Saprospiraceae bacterium]|nr:sterol desaturase family protein [Saprospiraceae bacterium]MCF8251813.1 sterol desaturase family protein [Saprospiraceae bacterium]MCF8281467.1 sterol desaturase family protein [Bacteroidales bacterium]MCF8313527.1 sterol desaturase family protein [Saprospiraceae bacterium]MCF8442250.1 sterol desaturase family protein [Saprospiraceae bacterium]